MAKQPVVFIQAPLVVGFHDALLTLLQEDNRRMANHLVLTISEACLDMWPLTLQDYKGPGTGEQQDAKIALNPERFPRLYALYTSLPPGVKGITMINLLNRHQMMKEASPEEANAALNRMLLSRTCDGTTAEGSVVDAQVAASVASVTPAMSPAASVIEAGVGVAAQVDPKQAQSHQEVEEVFDPLVNMPAMTF